jgi:DNA integrity scanning protein DisA with diadenylate cyclase activity
MNASTINLRKLENRTRFLSGLYSDLLENGIRYFFPGASLERVPRNPEHMPGLLGAVPSGGQLEFEWMGNGYSLTAASKLSEHERRLIRSIGMVLSSRYQLLTDEALAAQSFQLFRGLPEDRFVSAFLDPGPHASAEAIAQVPDRVADAIEVLRTSSMSTYENRRISTGVLLFGSMPEPCHEPPQTPATALRYSHQLTTIRSFHRLCDGLRTLALVDKDGMLAELIDLREWTELYRDMPLAVPPSVKYADHARATLCGGHICLVLSPNGEIKVFSDGVLVFRFIDGKWRLVDARHRYAMWQKAIGNDELAERLFSVALNLTEGRRGALFVVLEKAESAQALISQPDLVDHVNHDGLAEGITSKDQLHYLLRDRSILDVPSTVLENIARIDGAVVLCGDGNLLAFGAILHHQSTEEAINRTVEGGRTTAAITASHYGTVLKISEDGLISMYRGGQCLWEI